MPTTGLSWREHVAFRYWARRRWHTASKLRWFGPMPKAADDARESAAYCLDRPDSLSYAECEWS